MPEGEEEEEGEESGEVWRTYDNGLSIRRHVVTETWVAVGRRRTETEPTGVQFRRDRSSYTRRASVFDLVGPSTTIEIPDRHPYPLRDHVPRRLRLCDAVFNAVDIEDLCADPGCVPTAVAVRGPPYIATYLAGVHGEPESEIAERLSVTKETVTQYLSDVTAGRR